MTDPFLADVERHLLATFKESAADPAGDDLLRRESAGLALLPEASRAVAQAAALGVLQDLGKVVAELRAAQSPTPGQPEPDLRRIQHGIAYVATRKAGKALHAAFLYARKKSQEEQT